MFNKNLSKMDIFELFVGFIQLLSYQEIKNEVGNNDLDRKLDDQNNVYLKTIIKNQELMLSKLNEIMYQIDPVQKSIQDEIDKFINKKL